MQSVSADSYNNATQEISIFHMQGGNAAFRKAWEDLNIIMYPLPGRNKFFGNKEIQGFYLLGPSIEI